jgi:hypothetical protein
VKLKIISNAEISKFESLKARFFLVIRQAETSKI